MSKLSYALRLEKIILVEQKMNDYTRETLSEYLSESQLHNKFNKFKAKNQKLGPYGENNGYRWSVLANNLNDISIRRVIYDLHAMIINIGL